jgi:RNA polymerase sigma factor (sigma-70 family)
LLHRFGAAGRPSREDAAYLESLHLEDLGLACALSAGDERAWDHFITHYRPVLYAAARAIAGSDATGRELADSLYAELFSLGVAREKAARPAEGPFDAGAVPAIRPGGLLDYFHGRSKLSTWLRAVLAQRHVDAIRAARRTEPLEEAESGEPVAPGVRSFGPEGSGGPMPDPERERYLALLQEAVTQALAALEPRDRLRLAYYYVQDLTLAQIGRLLGEHEATVSRKLERTRRHVRERVLSALRAGEPASGRAGLSEAQVRLCLDYAVEEWPFDLTGALIRSEREE